MPGTVGVGQHNYLALVDGQGRVLTEIHGVARGGFFSGRLGIKEYHAVYDSNGLRTGRLLFNLGEEDRSNWVEVPPLQGNTAQETWEKFSVVARRHDEKFQYSALPSRIPKQLGSSENQLYQTHPTYNSNSAWRALLEENGYDWKRYHPKEGSLQFSPGDGVPLPRAGASDRQPLTSDRPLRWPGGPGDLKR